MSDEIRISASEALAAERAIERKADDAEKLISSLQRDVSGLKKWWKGESAIAFEEEFSKSKKDFDKIAECIKKYSDLLKKTIEIQQKTDADIARQMRS